MMNKADKYYKETIQEILDNGSWSTNPRTNWLDNTPAYYKQVRQKVYNYDISKGELPITTLRNTPLKGCFYEMEWIYIKQSNILEEAHPSIHGWWKDFVVQKEFEVKTSELLKKYGYKTTEDFNSWTSDLTPRKILGYPDVNYTNYLTGEERNSIGTTYGYIVREFNLVSNLLREMENNPESRRLNMDLWQESYLNMSPKPLPPCAYRTEWAIDGEFIDFTLYQRSRDLIVTYSTNPMEYVLLAWKIANHLTFKTGRKHTVRNFQHVVFNEHIYDRHIEEALEILKRESLEQPKVELICEPKLFENHTIEDFKFEVSHEIRQRNNKLEIAV